MDAVGQLRRLFQHNAWADDKLLTALGRKPFNADAWREYTHIIATAATWLDRVKRQTPRVKVWPTLSRDELEQLRMAVAAEYNAMIGTLTDADLDERIEYVNSAGAAFTTPLGEILLHVALHGQYHRGKVNLLLRQRAAEPAPTDFIEYVRGAPAATTTD